MNFKLGEFVRFVDERHEGYITRIFDDGMLGVTGDDDFEIPVPASKVTRVHGFTYKGVDTQATEQKPVPPEEFVHAGVHLAVQPDQAKGSVVYFHLVNETSFQLLISFGSGKDTLRKGLFAGIVAPNSTAKIHSASLTELSNWPKFFIEGIFYSTQEVKTKEPLQYEVKFAAKNFSGAKKDVKILNLQAWVFRIDEEELVIDAEKIKESFFKPAEEKKDLGQPQKEVDLHIEKLRDDYQFLNKDDILKIQLDQFQKALDTAIVHKQPSIVFIHGVGNGTLRYEIQKVISKHKQVKTYMDARKEKYGYGATEVIFK